MTKLVKNNIINVLSKLNGTGFVGLDALTTVKALPGGKKNEYQGRVTKQTTGIQAMVFENRYVSGYEQAVRRKLMESGLPADFKSGALPWGTKVENTPIILHKDEVYLQLIVRKKGQVQYFIDGQPVKKATIGEFDVLTDNDGVVLTNLAKAGSSEGQQGGLAEEDQIIVNTFNLKSITQLRAYGDTFSDLYYEPEEQEYEVVVTHTVTVKAVNEESAKSTAYDMIREDSTVIDHSATTKVLEPK